MKRPKSISIVIPAFNEADYIAETLARIRRAVHGGWGEEVLYEIIVCDNNPSDETAALASQTGARVVFEGKNQIAKARNTGAATAKGEWLLFIDADTYPSAELMRDVLGEINAGGFIGCGTTIEVVDGTLLNKLRMERLNPLFRLFKFCGGAFILCRADAFRAIGGFSTGLYAYEEIDFVIRLKRYARKQGKSFKILHQHPVFTSGRKGHYTILSLAKLLLSNFTAVLLFGLYYVLPRKWVEAMGARLLGYWYDEWK